jgi:hypothetical protein
MIHHFQVIQCDFEIRVRACVDSYPLCSGKAAVLSTVGNFCY